MLTDPQSVTYDGNAKSLPRISSDTVGTMYRTADGEIALNIEHSVLPGGQRRVECKLTRVIPDPTPSNVFDMYRIKRNSVSIAFEVDALRANSSTDIPLLRTALLALVDSTLQGRLIGGER